MLCPILTVVEQNNVCCLTCEQAELCCCFPCVQQELSFIAAARPLVWICPDYTLCVYTDSPLRCSDAWPYRGAGVVLQARRWRKHERRADSQASIPAYVAPKTTFDHGCGTLFKAASSLVRVLAAACLFPVVWAGQLAARVYFVCLHKLPGYKSERLAAAVELAARDAEIAAVCAFAQSAQSALSAAQKSLHAETSKRQALQQELDTSAQQFKQLLRDQQQQHQAAMHATKEAAAAVVSAAEEQSAMAAAAAAAARSSQASLLAEGTIHLQQLKDCQQQVLAMQQAYRTLQEAHCQLVRSEQAAKQKADEAEEEVQHVMQERLQDLHAAQEQVDKAKATAKDAEVAAQKADLAAQQTEARMVEQLLPVYNAEVTTHCLWHAL